MTRSTEILMQLHQIYRRRLDKTPCWPCMLSPGYVAIQRLCSLPFWRLGRSCFLSSGTAGERNRFPLHTASLHWASAVLVAGGGWWSRGCGGWQSPGRVQEFGVGDPGVEAPGSSKRETCYQARQPAVSLMDPWKQSQQCGVLICSYVCCFLLRPLTGSTACAFAAFCSESGSVVS